MADWHIGQEIICVDTNWINPTNDRHPYPVKGRIYTITGIADEGEVYGCFFTLAEIPSNHSWYSFHFRPLKKKETDISVFRALLEPTGKKKVLEEV